jgi:hypothetical protein
MTKTAKDFLEAAKAEVPTITKAEVEKLMGRDDLVK